MSMIITKPGTTLTFESGIKVTIGERVTVEVGQANGKKIITGTVTHIYHYYDSIKLDNDDTKVYMVDNIVAQ